MDVNVIFSIMFIIFAAIMIGAGVYTKKWVQDSSDYILAGRQVSLPINIMGVAAIGFAGTTVALAPGYSILYGFKGSIIWGGIYAAFGLILYGNLFSNFIRRSGAQTLPEYLEMRYDSRVRNIVAVGTTIGLCGILANNIVSCVQIVSGFVGWSEGVVMALIFLIILIFTYISGLWAATVTDFFQVSVGIIAIPLFLGLLKSKFGGFDFIAANWPGGNWWGVGITGNEMPVLAFKYPSALTFMLLFGAALVWGNNYYWLKIASSRSEKLAKNAFTYAGIMLIVVFMIPLGILGLYGGAAMPEQFTVMGGTVPPTAVYGVLARLFPAVVSSFFIIGSVAASISTASTSALGATSTVTRDIYQRIINPNASPETKLKASRIIMILVGLLTWALCNFPGGPTYLFAFANAWLVPPAVLLCLGIIWPKFNSKGAFVGVTAGIISMALLTILELTGVFNIGAYTHSALVGFAVTLIFAIIGNSFGKGKYYSESDWNIDPEKSKRDNIKLNKKDLEVLELLRVGHKYMADITDSLGVDSQESNDIIERLDLGGYLQRAGLTGSKFYEFEITSKGINALPELQDEEQKLINNNLNTEYIGFLQAAKVSDEEVVKYVKSKEWNSLKLSSITSHLTREGFIVEKGWFRRKIELTEKAISAIK